MNRMVHRSELHHPMGHYRHRIHSWTGPLPDRARPRALGTTPASSRRLRLNLSTSSRSCAQAITTPSGHEKLVLRIRHPLAVAADMRAKQLPSDLGRSVRSESVEQPSGPAHPAFLRAHDLRKSPHPQLGTEPSVEPLPRRRNSARGHPCRPDYRALGISPRRRIVVGDQDGVDKRIETSDIRSAVEPWRAR